MSSEAKLVKILSWLMLLLGLVGLATGLFAAVAAPTTAGAPGIENPIVSAEALGVALAITGAVYLIAGISGAKGANSPANLGSFITLATVLAIINIIEAVLAFMSAGSVWQNIALALVAAMAVACAVRAKARAIR